MTRTSPPRISCVVPAFNEAANLPMLIDMLAQTLDTLSRSWEILVVDDGSRDATPLVMALQAERAGVRYLRLSRNFGKEHALTAGIDHALGDVVILLDADLQHPTHLLGSMLELWREGADMVYAVRRERSDESFLKRLGTRFFYRLVNWGSRAKIPENAGDFRLMDRRVVDALKSLPERNRFMKGLYAWVGFNAVPMPYDPAERAQGVSTFSLRRLAGMALVGLTAFSTWPLRLWSGLGFCLALLAFGYGCWVVGEYFFWGIRVPGYATIVVSTMFFSGVQLLSIGIIGEYLARIYEEAKGRPIYILAEDRGQGLTPPPAP